jgi:hypothetical protein
MKTVVKVYLLPPLNEDKLQALHADIVTAVKSCLDDVKSEDDMLALFIPDLMKKGLGTEIHTEIDVPANLLGYGEPEDRLAAAVGLAVKKHLPDVYIQSKVYKYHPRDGAWSSDLQTDVAQGGLFAPAAKKE